MRVDRTAVVPLYSCVGGSKKKKNAKKKKKKKKLSSLSCYITIYETLCMSLDIRFVSKINWSAYCTYTPGNWRNPLPITIKTGPGRTKFRSWISQPKICNIPLPQEHTHTCTHARILLSSFILIQPQSTFTCSFCRVLLLRGSKVSRKRRCCPSCLQFQGSSTGTRRDFHACHTASV